MREIENYVLTFYSTYTCRPGLTCKILESFDIITGVIDIVLEEPSNSAFQLIEHDEPCDDRPAI